jgi:hypothetical protein
MDTLRNLHVGKFDLESVYEERDFKPHLWCLLSALIVVTVCSRSSFLYVFNIWDDANSYFTVGKCIFRGFVPYRDLFDQKGIMLYFIYGIASLISPKTFIGVYIFEVLAAFLSILAVFRIYQLFLEEKTMCYIITPITAAVIYTSVDFWWGGSAEEFLFPWIMWGLYLSVKYFRTEYPEPMSYLKVLMGGVLAGFVLNIKFNSLGFFFAWMAAVFFADIIGMGAVKKAFASCFVFLSGMGLATLPWVIYFGVNRAIKDWLYVYIYKNVFEYSQKLTLGERIVKFYDIMKNHFLGNTLVFVIIFIGMVYFIATTVMTAVRRDRHFEKEEFLIDLKVPELLNLGALLFFLVLVIFIGGVSLPYYPFPMNGFVVFGFIPICYIIEKFLNEVLSYLLMAAAVLLTVGGCFLLSVNVKSMNLKESDLFLYKFRDYIVSTGVEDPGIILEYTFDVGLYTVLDVEPICYYFQTQTLNMQEVLDYQKQYVHNGEADFVVSVGGYAEGLGDRYDLIMTDRLVFYNFDQTYYLYQRNENPVTEEN